MAAWILASIRPKGLRAKLLLTNSDCGVANELGSEASGRPQGFIFVRERNVSAPWATNEGGWVISKKGPRSAGYHNAIKNTQRVAYIETCPSFSGS